mgnify:FL=1
MDDKELGRMLRLEKVSEHIVEDRMEDTIEEGKTQEELLKEKHDQLKFRLKKRIRPEVFARMPEEIQNFLIEMDPTDMKEVYISTLLNLPWKSEFKVSEIELMEAKNMLDNSHYAMKDVKEKVLRYMACQKYLGKNYGAVMLLAGPPGVGKTSIAMSIAKAMGRPCVKISLAGVSDALFLRGTQTIFNNAKPGRIVDALIHGKSFCPLILLDEIDKMGSSVEHGCPENVLLDILDSDRSKFVDNYLGFPLDLSNVIFIATANSLEPLSPILQDRLDIVELPPYTIEDKTEIVKGYIWPKLIHEYQIEKVELKEDAIKELIVLCPEEGVRDLERICRKICESIISLYYVEGNMIKYITSENLAKIMEPIYYR